MQPLHPAQQVVNLVNDQGGQPESSYVTIPSSVGTGSFEIFTATFPAFASVTQADYLSFREPNSLTKFAVWLDKDADGTAPSGALYTAAAQKVKASIVTGNTATQVAAAVKSALEAVGAFDEYAISAALGVLTFTANKLGDANRCIA